MNEAYHPQRDLLTGIKRMFPLPLLPWDDYYMSMAQTDFLCGLHDEQCTKTFFIRNAPFGGSYAILGGLTAFLRIVDEYRFTASVANALTEMGYRTEFTKYLVHTHPRLNVKIYSPPEGSIILGHEPAIVMQGDKLSIRIVEGILLREINFPTLSITKWHRVDEAASPGATLEFARRRAQDDVRTSLYAHLGGATVSSNDEIRCGFDIPTSGTMGHEWVQSIGDEFRAFDLWLEHNPSKPVLLVDTVNTLKSGIPNAIKAFKKHWGKIKAAGGRPGIRLDSGDLAYLAIEARKMLDSEGVSPGSSALSPLNEVMIYMTNDLDEYKIQTIREQIYTFAIRAGIDPVAMLSKIVWGAGTMPGTCNDQPSLGGVAKLTSIMRAGSDGIITEKAVIKLAGDNSEKTSIPGNNRSTYVWRGTELVCCLVHSHDEDPDGQFRHWAYDINDKSKAIDLSDPELKFELRQQLVYDSENDAVFLSHRPSIDEVRAHVKQETSRLHWTTKRFEKPHKIKVSLSEYVFDLRQHLIMNRMLIEN